MTTTEITTAFLTAANQNLSQLSRDYKNAHGPAAVITFHGGTGTGKVLSLTPAGSLVIESFGQTFLIPKSYVTKVESN